MGGFLITKDDIKYEPFLPRASITGIGEKSLGLPQIFLDQSRNARLPPKRDSRRLWLMFKHPESRKRQYGTAIKRTDTKLILKYIFDRNFRYLRKHFDRRNREKEKSYKI
jgi:hypothetical protein